MRNQPIPLINGFYADRARPFSMQDCCNWLPSVAEVTGTRTEVMLKTPPGLVPFAQIGDDPCRLVYEAEGRFFAVSGDSLYQIAPDSLPTLLGTIPGVTPVRAAHNQIENGNQIVFVNGSAGFVWNTVDSTFTVISDPGFPGAVDVVFCDGYFVFIEPSRRFAFNSDLADALAYNTLDRFTSEVSPDMLQGLAVNNNELVLFSETTTEFFENVGAAQQPFRSKRISFQKGAAARYGIAQIDNTVKWLANDGMFYKLDGYAPRRISYRPIEQAIRGKNWAQAFAFIWETEGHSVCYWTFPDGLTWGNDASQPPGLDWHRRESYGLTRWRINSTAFWQDAWYAGDFQTGRVWRLDWDYPMEGDTEMVGQITGPVMHDNQNLVQMPKLEIVMDTGMPEAVSDFRIYGDLGDGNSGEAVDYQYGEIGGVLPVAYSVISGSVPAGTSLNSSGQITGTRTTPGVYSWRVQGIDAAGRIATLDDTSETIFVAVPVFAAIDNSALLYKSVDGAAWPGTTVASGLGGTSSNVLCEYGGGRLFHIISSQGRVSTDTGSNWGALAGIPAGTPSALAYTGTHWLLLMGFGKDVYRSADGVTFAAVGGTNDNWWGVAVNGSTIIAGGSAGQVHRSTDHGATWTRGIATGMAGAVTNVVATATGFAAFSDAGECAVSTTGAAASWTLKTLAHISACMGAAFGGGLVVVGHVNGTSSVSADNGLTWATGGSYTHFGALAGGQDNKMCFADSLFIMGNKIDGTHNGIITSPTGATWTQAFSVASVNALDSFTPAG